MQLQVKNVLVAKNIKITLKPLGVTYKKKTKQKEFKQKKLGRGNSHHPPVRQK